MRSFKLLLAGFILVCLGPFLGFIPGNSGHLIAQLRKPKRDLGRIHKGGGAYYRKQRAKTLTQDQLPYHYGETLICSDCHVMHASMQHNYQGTVEGEGGVSGFPYEFEPSPNLLKAPDPLDVCLACHDGQVGIPDVVGADVNGLQERSAGFFDEPEVENPRGHDLGRGLPKAPDELCSRCHWGDPEDRKVTCIDCHNPHGNGNPRNLQWASWPEATPPLGLFNPPGVTGLDKYERQNVAYGTLNTSELREVTNMCLDCHHVFTGAWYNDPDGDNIHSLHPSYDSERDDPNNIAQGAARGTTDPEHWEAGQGSGFEGTERVPFVTSGATNYDEATVIDADINGVFCLSCHKVHGSSSAFGLVWELDMSDPRRGCDQCHAVRPLP
jgi:hypothetical protein